MERWPQSRHVDHSDYLPPERPGVVHALLRALRPEVIVVSRGDLWPELVHGAYAGGIPVAVVGASVRPGSRRLRWPARELMRSTYEGLRFVGAVSGDDADRWIRLGAPPDAVAVTGDPRDDHVLERPSSYAALLPLIPWAHKGPTLVAGSTHHRDEEILIAALARIGTNRPEARLIVVPHEVTPESTARVARDTARLGIVAAGWTEGSPARETRVVVVERHGLLADLYALGTLAYVGGGFGAGVHSMAEPAAYGVPTLAGPAARKERLAARFLASGGAVALDGDHPVESLAERWEAWLAQPDVRTAAGTAARRELDTGAADRTVGALKPLLPARG